MGKFAEAYEEFRAVQEAYAEFGACDTEPRGVFYGLIESVYKGQEPAIPDTVNGWDLYSTMRGSKKAAKALAKAARAAVKAAMKDTIGVARFVNYY